MARSLAPTQRRLAVRRDRPQRPVLTINLSPINCRHPRSFFRSVELMVDRVYLFNRRARVK